MTLTTKKNIGSTREQTQLSQTTITGHCCAE
jgi:hypothetical protein